MYSSSQFCAHSFWTDFAIISARPTLLIPCSSVLHWYERFSPLLPALVFGDTETFAPLMNERKKSSFLWPLLSLLQASRTSASWSQVHQFFLLSPVVIFQTPQGLRVCERCVAGGQRRHDSCSSFISSWHLTCWYRGSQLERGWAESRQQLRLRWV